METNQKLISQAIICLNENNLTEAEALLNKAIALNSASPQIHNLFGILAEFRGNKNLAGKYYRAASALDPSYRPAINNLDRVTQFSTSFNTIKNMDFGDINIEDHDDYKIVYDHNKIGHIQKKHHF